MNDRPSPIVIPRPPGVIAPASALVGGLLLASSTLTGCHAPAVVATHTPTFSGNHLYCRQIDDFMAGMTARKVARHHMALNVSADCPAPSCDYRRGFEQAYVDVALGASGKAPAVPPAMYWQAGFRTPEGHARVDEWYHGYCDGAQHAVPLRGEYNKVQPGSCPGGCPPGGPS